MERKENATSPLCCINTQNVANVAAYHHILDPSVLRRTSDVNSATTLDIIHIHVYSDVESVVRVISVIQQIVLSGSRLVTIAISGDTYLKFAYRNALMNWVTK